MFLKLLFVVVIPNSVFDQSKKESAMHSNAKILKPLQLTTKIFITKRQQTPDSVKLNKPNSYKYPKLWVTL
jgi:hypothetical protein